MKVIYAEGKAVSSLPKTLYKGHLNVIPRVPYIISIEVLQTLKTKLNPIVTDIMMDNIHVGDCTPEGETEDCTFFLCTTTEKRPITSETGTIDVSMVFTDHSWKCNCDTRNWYCNPHANNPSQLPMVAVARITLESQTSLSNSGNNMFEIDFEI